MKHIFDILEDAKLPQETIRLLEDTLHEMCTETKEDPSVDVDEEYFEEMTKFFVRGFAFGLCAAGKISEAVYQKIVDQLYDGFEQEAVDFDEDDDEEYDLEDDYDDDDDDGEDY